MMGFQNSSPIGRVGRKEGSLLEPVGGSVSLDWSEFSNSSKMGLNIREGVEGFLRINSKLVLDLKEEEVSVGYILSCSKLFTSKKCLNILEDG
jgi:hypothetical protein